MAGTKLILDRYRPLGEIGAGGFGTVQVAWDPRIQRKVAIKTIELTEFDAARAMLPGADAVSRLHGAKAGETADRWHGVLPWDDVAGEDASETAVMNPVGSAAPQAAPPAASSAAGAFASPSETVSLQPAVAANGSAALKTPGAPAQQPGCRAAAVSPTDRTVVLPWEDARSAPAGASEPGASDSDAAEPTTATRGIDFDPSDVHALAHIPGLDEARTAAMLSDPRIVTVYDFEVRDRTAYLIMEYVEGITLTKVLNEYDSYLTIDMVAAVFDAVAGALEAAHKSGVLHLDIKPDNILINKDGQVKVTDFGLATLADAAGLGTTGGGTIGYMPPEQMNRDVLDARADEWALASVTYEMLAGDNPFRVPNLADAEAAIENAELVLPSLCWDGLDEQLDDVLFYALDPNRDERYASVADFAEEADKFLGDAQKGRRQLKMVVGDALGGGPSEGEEEEGEEDAADGRTRSVARAPHVPMSQRITPKMLKIAARAFAAVGSAFTTFVAMSNAPITAYMEVDPAMVSGLAILIVAVVGAIVPSVGALVAFCLLSLALVTAGSPIAGLVMLTLTVVWFVFAARGTKAEANEALALPLVGAIGGNAFVPLACGAASRPKRALITTVFALAWAFVLGAAGTGNLLGWNAPVYLTSLDNTVIQQRLGIMLTRPANWCMAAGWLAAAGFGSACCLKRTRTWRIVGACASSAVLLAGSLGAAWIDSGMRSLVPSAPLLVPIIVSAVIVIVVTACLQPDEGASVEVDAEA